jgi:DNA-directed RNA polymerase subunit RPC12/RpoP
MPYSDCPNCRLTVYFAPRMTDIKKCPRCGSKRLGEPGRLSSQVRNFQRSVGCARPQGPKRPAVGG